MIPQDKTLHDLGERVKELTALHGTARILQDHRRPVDEVIPEVLALVPSAWQYPAITDARITIGGSGFATPGFAESPFRQRAVFVLGDGTSGVIDVYYREARPAEAEGPFLAEERNLIDSLAEMLRSFVERQRADARLRSARDELEVRVRERTVELTRVNEALQSEIAERIKQEREIHDYQAQLRTLALELSLTEERERRAIAGDLHDHIGQALAVMRMKLVTIRGHAMFTGLEDDLAAVNTLLDQTIRYTRSLTFEISPPLLYDLGLFAAIEWLGEDFTRKHALAVKVVDASPGGDSPGHLDDAVRVLLFKSVRELLMNVVKHARARAVTVEVRQRAAACEVRVTDDGAGFDLGAVEKRSAGAVGFGLFSIRERLHHLAGRVEIRSAPGRGTSVTLVVPMKGSHEERQARP